VVSVSRLLATYFDVLRVQQDGRTSTRLPTPLDSFTPAELAVHRCLLSHLNDKTGECFPSQDTLCAETRFSRRTVQRALDGLRMQGIWDWRARANTRGRGRAGNRYWLIDGPPTAEAEVAMWAARLTPNMAVAL
jgi:helix-turn-helix protein